MLLVVAQAVYPCAPCAAWCETSHTVNRCDCRMAVRLCLSPVCAARSRWCRCSSMPAATSIKRLWSVIVCAHCAV